MRKIFFVCYFAIASLTANAQFTTYQSVDPNVPQQQSTQNGSGYPFTIYQSADPDYIRQSNGFQQRPNRYATPQTQNSKIIRGVYLNSLTGEAEYIKLKMVSNGNQKYIRAYYVAESNLWLQCNAQLVALGYNDDDELRKYFTYKVSIPNIGTIYY